MPTELNCNSADTPAGRLQLVTANAACTDTEGEARYPDLSHDGRYLVFQYSGNDLVHNDENDERDVYFVDRAGGDVELVSLSITGRAGAGWSLAPTVTDDGRFVLFSSEVVNVAWVAPTDPFQHYLRDRDKGVSELVPHVDGCPAPGDLSPDGSSIVWDQYPSCNPSPDDPTPFTSYFLRLGGEPEPILVAAGLTQRLIRFADCNRLAALPSIHRDPFDRMLISQALEDGIPLVTKDEVISRYPLQTIW